MKKYLLLFAAATLFSCNNDRTVNTPPAKDSAQVVHDSIGSDPSTVIFNVTDEEALHLVSEVKEINVELKREFKEENVRNQLVLVQPASPEDANHYIQLMEMHDDHGVTLEHFRVDASTGEIRVMDPLAEEDSWITLEHWRKTKI
jgi:hypothetical protein